MEPKSYILITNKVKEHTGFHYLVPETQLRKLILLELNMFLKMYKTKSNMNIWNISKHT